MRAAREASVRPQRHARRPFMLGGHFRRLGLAAAAIDDVGRSYFRLGLNVTGSFKG